MSRPRKPARVTYRVDRDRWIIRDGATELWTDLAGIGNREAAEQRLAAYLADKQSRPGPSQPHQITVGAVLALYLREHAPTTAAPDRIAWAARALAPFWQNLTCDAAKGSTARAYARQRGVSPSTVRRELGVLNAAMAYAHAEGVLIHPIRLPLPEASRPRERWLTRAELRAVLRAAAPHLRRLLIIGVLTGTRPGTVLRTRWTPSLTEPWVDLGAGVYHRAGAAERATKKRRSSCKIPVPLLRLLRRWHRHGGSHVVLWKRRPIMDAGKGLDDACARAGVERVTPHVVKHTAITWAMQRGMSIEDASDFFATSPETLMRVYRQHSPLYQSRAAEIMGRRG